ncbi:MAG: type II secretion system protein [Limisphaerales bacterium]
MKTNFPKSFRVREGFTLVELLTVIAIIAILAALLLPVLSSAHTHALVVEAETQEHELVNAIQQYDSDYGRFPVSPGAQAAATAAGSDFTYGGTFAGDNPTPQPIGTATYLRTNDEVMAILLDVTNYPNSTAPTDNAGYQKNPRQINYLPQVHLNGNPTAAHDKTPGIGPDLVYRDPWGNPYIISMDLNYDGMCEDVIYQQKIFSGGGVNGLIQDRNDTFNAAKGNNWALKGTVMVWSAGPNGMIDAGESPNDAENRDNVLSWK